MTQMIMSKLFCYVKILTHKKKKKLILCAGYKTLIYYNNFGTNKNGFGHSHFPWQKNDCFQSNTKQKEQNQCNQGFKVIRTNLHTYMNIYTA